jgi:hypothetical protein
MPACHRWAFRSLQGRTRLRQRLGLNVGDFVSSMKNDIASSEIGVVLSP